MDSHAQRRNLVESLYPAGLPRLWCPMLTHFLADGQVDSARVRRHLEVLSPYAKGILLPGSTGEGWEMTDAEVAQLLAIVLDAAQELGLHLLIGVLRKKLDEMLAVIEGTVHRICDVTGRSSGLAALMAARVVGFTVCPISGAELTQRQLCEGLTAILELGHPTAIYQLPQVTQNELSAECTARLAADYPNFYLLKDTSGDDRVARAGLDYHGVFLVRGAEGEYHRWLRTSGGCYDGFLLSSANCFARELAAMANLLAAGQMEAAARLSRRIERVVLGCFEIVSGFPFANPFTNANKIMDHVLAYGRDCLCQPPPYLRAGRQLPAAFVEQAYELMAREELAPERGYL